MDDAAALPDTRTLEKSVFENFPEPSLS
jgi:hypothetical protein